MKRAWARNRAGVVVTGALVAAAGCGGAGAPATVAAAATAEAFCHQLLTAVIERETCLYGSPRVMEKMIKPDETCAALATAVASGSVRYDQPQGTACLGWLQARACDRHRWFADAVGPCQQALTGTVAAGGACHALVELPYVSECTGSAFCRLDETCPGVCQTYAADGAACDGAHPCAPGLICNVGGTCQPAGQEGEPCNKDTVVVDFLPRIYARSVCAEPFTCTGSPARCGRALPEGAACDVTRDVCAYGWCGSDHRCVAQHALGQPCTLASDTDPFPAPFVCGMYVLCVDGRCVDPPFAGESCISPTAPYCGGGDVCGPDLVCMSPPPPVRPVKCWPGTRCGHPGETCCAIVMSTGGDAPPTGCAGGAACGADGKCP